MDAAASRRARLLLLVLVLALPPARLFGPVHAHSSRPYPFPSQGIWRLCFTRLGLTKKIRIDLKEARALHPHKLSLSRAFLALSWKFAQPIGPRFKKADNSHFPPRQQQASSISSPLKSLLTLFFSWFPPILPCIDRPATFLSQKALYHL